MSCGTSGAVDERIAFLDVVAGVHAQMLAVRHQVFLLDADGLAGVVDGLDDDGALALAFFAQADAAGNLGHDGGLARPAGLEDFRDARQTAGDVLGAAHFARRLGQQRPGRHHLAGPHFQVGLFRDVVHFQASGPVHPR